MPLLSRLRSVEMRLIVANRWGVRVQVKGLQGLVKP